MKTLILGNSYDDHSVHIKNALEQAGADVDYLDTHLFPTQLCMSWQLNSKIKSLKLPEKNRWNLENIYSVFWRSISEPYIPSLEDFNQQKIAFNDSMSALQTLIQACPARWVNCWQAYQFHKQKPLQLQQVKQLGIKTPATLISNDPTQIIEFAQSYEKVIFKPVSGGAYTQMVTEEDLEPKRLNLALRLSPVTIQEYIPGTNIRSYVIGKSIYSAEIRSNYLDFREDSHADLIPIELPEAIRQQCLAITKALMLEWTAIDWRLKPTGEYVFLEANFSPMFLHFERQTNFPITQNLVKLLIN